MKTTARVATEQVQVSSLQMSCPKCKVELSITDDPIYGKVYVCEACGILVIELNACMNMLPELIPTKKMGIK